MNIRTLVLALLVVLFIPDSGHAQQPVGDAKAGQRAFNSGVAFCQLCHGGMAQGGFGPDLAGTGLTFTQFKRAVQTPWGVMPAFRNIDDQALTNIYTWLTSLEKVAAPAPPRTVVPDDAPLGQKLAASYGCAHCHGAELADPRRDLGGYGNVDIELLKRMLYDGERPTYERAQGKRPNRMGVFSRARLPESALQEIFHWMKDEQGLRVPMVAEITAAPGGTGTAYTLTIDNEGEKGKGLAAEEITVSLVLPAGAKVLTTTGKGYVGVQADPDTKMPAATWKIAKIAAGEKPQMSVTIEGTSVPDGAFKGSAIRWNKPAQKRPANQMLKDARIPEPPGDWIATSGMSQRASGQIMPLVVTPQPPKK